jgi:hypothetical protein
MAINPGYQTSFCITLVGTKHFLIRNETLKNRSYPHVVDTHEHACNEPRGHGDEEKRTDGTVQLFAEVFLYGEVGDPGGKGGDENFPHKDDPSRHVCYCCHSSGISKT